MAEQPLDRCNSSQLQVWGGVGGGESHQSSVPSQSTANLADPAELRDTNHEARRMASAPVLMTGA